MAYNPNIDYQAEMQKYLKSGGKKTDPTYQQYAKARQEKIAAATPGQLQQWGVDKEIQNQMMNTVNKMSNFVSSIPGIPAGSTLKPVIGISKTVIGAPASTKLNTDLPNTGTDFETLKSMLEQLLSQQQKPAYDIEAAKSRIQNWGDELKASLIAKIEAAKQAGLGQYANAGTLAQQQTKAALDQNAIDKARAIEQILQASEAAGQTRGGMNISGQIAANTTAQQNANLARQNLQNNLAAIEQAKADVSTQAEQSKIAAESDVEARVLQAIMDAERMAADVDLQSRGLDLQQKQFDFTKDLQQKQFDADQAWREWTKQFEIENQAWQRSPDNPALQSQILANKAAILNNQLLALELQNYPEEHKLRMEQLRKEIAQIGKAPPMSQYEKDLQNIKLNQAKIELENMRKGQKTDYAPFINQLYVAGKTTVDKAGIIDYLENLANSGVPKSDIRELAAKFGIKM